MRNDTSPMSRDKKSLEEQIYEKWGDDFTKD